MESKTNLSEKTQQNPRQNLESSCSEIFLEKKQNPSLELQQHFSEFFSSQQTQAEIERLRLQHQQRIGAASQNSRKQELERNHFIQRLNQADIEIQHVNFTLETTKIIASTAKMYHYNKLQDLNFPFLHHSSFI